MPIPDVANEATTLPVDLLNAVQEAIKQRLVTRIWEKDTTVWSNDEQVCKTIADRLGWLTVPDWSLGRLSKIIDFADEVRKDGITSIVILGMGGSSLCVEVLRDTFEAKKGYPNLLVLDSTHPDQVLAVERACDLKKTLFIVASKSGTTLEPQCYYEYFWNKLEQYGSDRRLNFAAITDPGTPLEKMAIDLQFRGVFANPPDIGGRYSALSYFGMVPAALIGIDIEEVLSRASSEAGLSKAEDERNASLILGLFMGRAAKDGRDKLTIVTPPELHSFGYWAEQLIAESTGKLGRGILPVEGESERARNEQRERRIYTYFTIGEGALSDDERRDPIRLELHLADQLGIGAQFFRWEFATAIAGSILGIDPFDEPNVAESKAKTNEVLAGYNGQHLKFPNVSGSIDNVDVIGQPLAQNLSQTLNQFLSKSVRPEGYIAIMAYIERNERSIAALAELRDKLSLKYHVPVTVGFGPRFLHSTGQLHKGGQPTGTFIQLTDTPKEDIPIPGKPYTFGSLIHAQAIGDFETLRKHDRPVIGFSLGNDPLAAIAALA